MYAPTATAAMKQMSTAFNGRSTNPFSDASNIINSYLDKQAVVTGTQQPTSRRETRPVKQSAKAKNNGGATRRAAKPATQSYHQPAQAVPTRQAHSSASAALPWWHVAPTATRTIWGAAGYSSQPFPQYAPSSSDDSYSHIYMPRPQYAPAPSLTPFYYVQPVYTPAPAPTPEPTPQPSFTPTIPRPIGIIRRVAAPAPPPKKYHVSADGSLRFEACTRADVLPEEPELTQEEENLGIFYYPDPVPGSDEWQMVSCIHGAVPVKTLQAAPGQPTTVQFLYA
ncbi:hypothetical protein C8R43DRAFT_1203993 [Mycena crocata]|nr:hypothetical protein C8R43DRAFT_1203993 [Mycena crocata]